MRASSVTPVAVPAAPPAMTAPPTATAAASSRSRLRRRRCRNASGSTSSTSAQIVRTVYDSPQSRSTTDGRASRMAANAVSTFVGPGAMRASAREEKHGRDEEQHVRGAPHALGPGGGRPHADEVTPPEPCRARHVLSLSALPRLPARYVRT